MARRTSDGGMRVGEVAAASGVSVRTLHHYESLGLVLPMGRSVAGHRLYDEAAIQQLYRVSMLRSLGMSLAQVRAITGQDPPSLRETFSEHFARATERAERHHRVRARLAALVEQLADREATTRDVLQLLEDVVTLTPAVERRISILVYRDLDAAHDYLTRVFGFGAGELTRDGKGVAQHAVVH